MIKANELRRGNWILPQHDLDGAYHTVKTLEKESINGIVESWYSPIPLTNEILEKAGFNKGSFGRVLYQEDGQYWKNGDVEIVQFKDGVALFGSEWTHSIRLPYVHQLQNLYFSLTGKELEINL